MQSSFVGLDPASGRGVRNLVRELKQAGRTVFLTTHDMTVADELCDRVAFIVDGEIRLVESPNDLKLAHGARTVAVESAWPTALGLPRCRSTPSPRPGVSRHAALLMRPSLRRTRLADGRPVAAGRSSR